jgi:hypothetical protein
MTRMMRYFLTMVWFIGLCIFIAPWLLGDEPPTDKPADKPAEKSTEKPVDEPAAKPAEKPTTPVAPTEKDAEPPSDKKATDDDKPVTPSAPTAKPKGRLPWAKSEAAPAAATSKKVVTARELLVNLDDSQLQAFVDGRSWWLMRTNR